MKMGSAHSPSRWFPERGLREFYGFVEPMNHRMTALCERLGMTRSRVSDDLVRVSLSLAG
jgi:RimJ/RimL family protein N-acetyltransferase